MFIQWVFYWQTWFPVISIETVTKHPLCDQYPSGDRLYIKLPTDRQMFNTSETGTKLQRNLIIAVTVCGYQCIQCTVYMHFKSPVTKNH